MHIRLVKATENDYSMVEKFIKNTSYHWMIVSTPLERRMENLTLCRFPPKPRFGRDGKLPTATEKFAYYSEKDYLKQYAYIKAERGEILMVYDDDTIIGFVYWRPECSQRRIVEFPLEFQYQNAETVREVVRQLLKKLKPNVKMFTIYAGEIARDLLVNIPQIHVGLSSCKS